MNVIRDNIYAGAIITNTLNLLLANAVSMRALGEKTTHDRGLFAITPIYSVLYFTSPI